MDRTWNRCVAAGAAALALGVTGAVATGGEVQGPSGATPRPVISYFRGAPPGAAVVTRVTRALLCAFFC